MYKRQRSHHGTSCFAGKLVCGCCGGLYGSKVWHSTDKYRRVIWQCNGKFKGKDKCDTPHLTEEAIQRKFLAAFNALLENRDFIIEDTKELMARLTDTHGLEKEASHLRNEMAGISQSVRALIDRNARSGVEQGEYELSLIHICHLCEKGDGAVVCAISGVGLGRRAAQCYNLLRHGPQAPFERLCCNSILSAA